MDLLAAEITAATGKDPGEHYRAIEAEFGSPVYARIDAPANWPAEAGAGSTSRPTWSRPPSWRASRSWQS